MAVVAVAISVALGYNLTGCALTPQERCAQAQLALSTAEALPANPDRASRIALYRLAVARECSAQWESRQPESQPKVE